MKTTGLEKLISAPKPYPRGAAGQSLGTSKPSLSISSSSTTSHEASERTVPGALASTSEGLLEEVSVCSALSPCVVGS